MIAYLLLILLVMTSRAHEQYVFQRVESDVVVQHIGNILIVKSSQPLRLMEQPGARQYSYLADCTDADCMWLLRPGTRYLVRQDSDRLIVDYYGNESPLSQVSSIKAEDARTLILVVWEKDMVSKIEKAIIDSDLGLNPAVAGTNIRIAMPPLTEERRMDFIKLVKNEVEQTKVAIRNIRRDANTKAKELVKNKEISEDDEKNHNDQIQKLTDLHIGNIDDILKDKEADLMQV